MTKLNEAMREQVIDLVEGFDIDVLNWRDDCVASYDLTVLEAAQSFIGTCTLQERANVRHRGRRKIRAYTSVFRRLHRTETTDVEPEPVSAVIVLMYEAVR